MRLRKKDIKLAKSTKNHTAALDKRHAARQLITASTNDLKRLGYRIRMKSGPKGWKSKRMSTAMRKTVWLGVGFEKKPLVDQAATLMHELVHARQYRAHSFFLARYIADSRFRFAMEAQAYRETIRAYRSTGSPDSALKGYAKRLNSKFAKSYRILGRRMRKDVRKHMGNIVMMP